MDFTLRRWSREGRPERIYLNDYAVGATVYVEREGAALRVRATGRDAPSDERVLADLRTRFRLPALTWDALSRLTDGATPPPRPVRAEAGSPPGDAVLAAALAERPLPFRVELLAGPEVPEPMLSMLGNLRGLAVERARPSLCHLAVPGRLAFVLARPADHARDSTAPLAEAEARDGAYAASYLLVEGMQAMGRDELGPAGLVTAALVARTRTVPVACLSPAHAGFLAACLLRESLAV